MMSIHDNLRSGLRFVMKHYLLHDFKAATPFREKFFTRFKNSHKPKLLKSFDVNLTTFQGGVVKR